MTLPRETFVDMLATASADGMPPNLSSAAILIMAREMVSRLPRDYRRYYRGSDAPSAQQSHFAWNDYDSFYPSAPGLDALLYHEADLELPVEERRIRFRFGQTAKKALSYLNYKSGSFPGGSVPYTPAHAALVPDTSGLIEMAADLRDMAIDEIGSTAFNAARLPFIERFALDDFHARRDVARYGVVGTAAPGERFHLATRGGAVAGFAQLDEPSWPEITVPAPGTYKTRFHGVVRSAATANPTTVEVSLQVDGVEVASHALQRASANPAEFVRFTPQDAEIEVDGVLTVRNGSAADEYAAGVLLVWSE